MLRLLLIALLAVARLADAAPPSSIAVTYEVRMNGMNVATVDESYRAEAGSYRLTSSSTPIGILAAVRRLAVRFASSGTVTSHGLQPRHFEGRRATGEIPEVAAEFDWSAGELKLTHEGRNETVALPPGAQDRLSVMYQFMFVAPKAPDTIDVAVTNGRRLDTYAYSITRDVEQDTPLGRLKTLHLVKQRERGDPENEIWLSPEHGYVPVRMVIVERDGTRYEQLATKLELKP
ncbi:MAG: DUF3108 domain-containing protein [Rhodospirillaceae bacterium]